MTECEFPVFGVWMPVVRKLNVSFTNRSQKFTAC